MTKVRTLMSILAALGLMWLMASPASGSITWSTERSAYDCLGHGCITVYFRVNVDNPDEGFYLEGVKISAKSHDSTFYDHLDGKGASCWNDRSNVIWSKDGSETNLAAGAHRMWDTEISLTGTATLTCSYLYNEVYANGGAGINNCSKVKLERGKGAVSGFCAWNG